MSPRRITISARTAATLAYPTAPVVDDLTQVITDWTYVLPEDGLYFRIIGEAPFKGRVIGAVFIPDTDIVEADADNHIRADLINAGQTGAGRVALTAPIKSYEDIVLLTPVEFDPVPSGSWANPPAVNEGDLISLRIWHVIDGVPYAERPALSSLTLTGTVTVYFQKGGGA